MIKTLLLIIELITSAALIFAILLHAPKGDGIGAIGGAARMFNAQKGMESGLNKVTTILAIVFVIIAGVLGVFF